MRKIMLMLSIVGLVLGAAVAQEMVSGEDFDIEKVQPIGNVETGEENLEADQDQNQNEGVIVLTHTTPGDQHANFDVVGPNGFHEHFDFEDAEEGERRLENLEPGVYSIAATDENLALAHTVVRVRSAKATTVHVDLQTWDQAAGEGQFDAAQTYGTYEGFGDDVQPGYPFGAYAVGPYEDFDGQDAGALVVGGLENDAELVVTGPNGFSQTVSGDDTLTDMPPGQYVLAATGEGLDLAVTTVQIQAGQQLSADPNFVEHTGGGQSQNQNEGQDGGGNNEGN